MNAPLEFFSTHWLVFKLLGFSSSLLSESYQFSNFLKVFFFSDFFFFVTFAFFWSKLLSNGWTPSSIYSSIALGLDCTKKLFHISKLLKISIMIQSFFESMNKEWSPSGGLEPPTFRLTVERASQLRHEGFVKKGWKFEKLKFFEVFDFDLLTNIA